MSQYTHTCIKCHKPYQDEDVDAYYCATCLEEHKAMAAVLDAQRISGGKSESMSQLEAFEKDPRTIVRNQGHTIFIRQSQL